MYPRCADTSPARRDLACGVRRRASKERESNLFALDGDSEVAPRQSAELKEIGLLQATVGLLSGVQPSQAFTRVSVDEDAREALEKRRKTSC
jgi:hypothetical protein